MDKEIEEIITLERLSLYNKGHPSGQRAIRKRLEYHNVLPLPSMAAIGRVLKKRGLTHGRTGFYHTDSYHPQNPDD